MKVFAMALLYQGFQPQGHALLKREIGAQCCLIPFSLLLLRSTLSSSLHVFIKLDCTGKCNESVPGHKQVTCWPQEERRGRRKSHCLRVELVLTELVSRLLAGAAGRHDHRWLITTKAQRQGVGCSRNAAVLC